MPTPNNRIGPDWTWDEEGDRRSTCNRDRLDQLLRVRHNNNQTGSGEHWDDTGLQIEAWLANLYELHRGPEQYLELLDAAWTRRSQALDRVEPRRIVQTLLDHNWSANYLTSYMLFWDAEVLD